MKCFSVIRSHRLISFYRGGFSFTEKRNYCRINFADSKIDGSCSTRMASPTILAVYKEEAAKEHGNVLIDVMENIPNSHVTFKKKSVAQPVSPTHLTLATKLHPHFDYFVQFGMDLEQLNRITKKCPAFRNYSLEDKIKPVVELLLDLGVSRSDIPYILNKWPLLCGSNISENLIPTMKFLANLGVDKKHQAKMVCQFPALINCSLQKVKANVDFLNEMGLSADNIVKVLKRCPSIISSSVEDKLRPTAEYFHSLGVDVALLLNGCPQNFTLSIDGNLKLVTNFFLERGYSIEEIGTMVSRFGTLYTYSIVKNLTPKWEFFLTMGYSRNELVKFPQYFGYSLEGRIKPRYARTKECGVRLGLSNLLPPPSHKFEILLNNKVKKMLAAKDHCSTQQE